MPKITLPLLKGDSQTNLDYRDLLPVNMTPVVRSIKGDQGYLLSADGIEKLCDTSGTARGGFYNERFKKHFRVSGDKLESIATDGTVEVIGLIPGKGVCKFASSFNTQAILADGRLFLYDNASLVEVTDPDLGFPVDITWFRGIYVLTDGSTVYQTDITDEYSISPLKFVTSEYSNDPTLAVKQTQNNQIIAFNSTSIEFFLFNPNVDANVSVLQAVQGKSVKIGIAGTNCVTEMDGAYFCLGSRENESYKVYSIGGAGQITQVSTRHINQILEDQTKLKDAYIESRYSDNQHIMIIHLADCTLCYNHTIATKTGIDNAWSILKSGVDSDVYRAKYGVFDPRVNKWIYGDIKESKLGYLVSDKSSQYGEPVECIAYTPLNYLDGNIVMQNITLQSIPGFSSGNVNLFYSFTDNGVIYGRESSFTITKEQMYKKSIRIRSGGFFADLLGVKFRIVSTEKQALSGCVIEFRQRATA